MSLAKRILVENASRKIVLVGFASRCLQYEFVVGIVAGCSLEMARWIALQSFKVRIMRPSRLEKKSVSMKKKKKKLGQEQGGARRQGGMERQGWMGRHEKKVYYLKIVTKNSLYEILYDSQGKLFSIVLFYVFA